MPNTGTATVISDPLCFLVRERGRNGCPHLTGKHVETPVKSRALGCWGVALGPQPSPSHSTLFSSYMTELRFKRTLVRTVNWVGKRRAPRLQTVVILTDRCDSEAAVLESVCPVPDCWRDLKCVWISPHCPARPAPPTQGLISAGHTAGTQETLPDWMGTFVLHVCIFDLPLFLVRHSWQISAYLGDIGAAALIHSKEESALWFGACTRKRTADLTQFRLFFMKSSLNLRAADLLILQILID